MECFGHKLEIFYTKLLIIWEGSAQFKLTWLCTFLKNRKCLTSPSDRGNEDVFIGLAKNCPFVRQTRWREYGIHYPIDAYKRSAESLN